MFNVLLVTGLMAAGIVCGLICETAGNVIKRIKRQKRLANRKPVCRVQRAGDLTFYQVTAR